MRLEREDLPAGAQQTSDEHSHPAGDHRLWSESWYFDFARFDGTCGGYFRLSVQPNDGTAWLWAVVQLPDADGPRVVFEHDAEVASSDPLMLSAGGSSLVAKCLEPGRWDIEATLSTEPNLLTEVELRWDDHGPRYFYRKAARYEQPASVAGNITSGSNTVRVVADGQRDHSWGVRDWWTVPWVWSSGSLDDSTRCNVTRLLTRRPTEPDGFILLGREIIAVQKADLAALPGPNDRYKAVIEGRPVVGTLTTMTVIEMTDGPRCSVLHRGLVCWEAGQGVGAGWTEWNLPRRSLVLS